MEESCIYKRSLHRGIDWHLGRASSYATKATINFRVLQDCLKELKISFQDIYDTKSLMHIAVSCSESIEKLWLEQIQNFTADENIVFERFLSKDFIRPNDLLKVAQVLIKRLPNHPEIKRIFAVDGIFCEHNENDNDLNTETLLSLEDLKHYFENLKIPMNETISNDITDPLRKHVIIVRKIYQEFPHLCWRRLGRILKKILFLQDEQEEEEYNADEENEIIHFYKTSIGNCFEEITKLLEKQLMKQNNKKRKRSEDICKRKKIKIVTEST